MLQHIIGIGIQQNTLGRCHLCRRNACPQGVVGLGGHGFALFQDGPIVMDHYSNSRDLRVVLRLDVNGLADLVCDKVYNQNRSCAFSALEGIYKYDGARRSIVKYTDPFCRHS
jgi:hypothetical protein